MAFELQRLPETEEELFWVVKAMWGVTIPRQVVCPDHVAPMTAFADAYFGRNSINPEFGITSMALWHGSRGLSGKSYMLAVLGLTKAVLLGSDVNLLGGSFEQSKNIHIHMRNSWDWEQAPKYMLAKNGATEVILTNKATIHPLTASQNTVRGPHPPFLLLDEIDEMDQEILDAALGQPLRQKNYLKQWVKPYAVMCLAGSSRILTPAGEVPLDSIQVGTQVMTRQGWRPVKNFWRNGYREVIEVELSNGRVLTCTPDHRIATPRGWLEAGSLTVGQELCGVREPVFVVCVRIEKTLVPVYDLEVDGIHEYLAEGVTVSNCSTWQHPDGTFTEMKKRAEENNYPVYTWCFLETANPIDGWLTEEAIAEKKASIPKEMWRVEYELGEPSIGNRAFDSASIERAFSLPFAPEYDEAGDPIPGTGYLYKREGKDYEEYRFEKYERDGRYVAGADWAQTQDYTVIAVGRIDVKPFRLVYYMRFNRLPYPVMIKKFEDAIEEYQAFAEHDGTGLGAVVHDLLEHERARKFVMAGEKRSAMLSEYVAAVENDRWVFPKIKSAYTEHKYAQVGDLYSNKQEFHLPDSVCAFGLMEHVAKRFVGPVVPLNITKNPEFQNRIQKVLDRPLDRIAEVEIKDAGAESAFSLLV